MDGWMDKEMNEWNIEWIDDEEWINGMDGWIRKWMNEILNEWMMKSE